MPTDSPQFGEVWTMNDPLTARPMDGIVGDVNPQRVLFVSLTGSRHAVAGSRLNLVWRFSRVALQDPDLPNCSRAGCGNQGVTRCTRRSGAHEEYACPRHIPIGIRSEYTSVAENYTVPIHAVSCPSCRNSDPVEDVRFAIAGARLWGCAFCSTARWITIETPSSPSARLRLYDDTLLETARHNIEATNILLSTRGYSALVEVIDGRSVFHTLPATPTVDLPPPVEAVITLRTAPRRPVRRLGGAPDRGGVVDTRQTPNMRQIFQEMLSEAPAPPLDLHQEHPITSLVMGNARGEASTIANTMRRALEEVPTPSRVLTRHPESPVMDNEITAESQWIQKSSADIIEVLGIERALDGSPIIRFRRTAEDNEPAVRLSRPDFLALHRPYNPNHPSSVDPSKPPIEITIGEEWASSDGDSIVISSVDGRKEIVYGDDLNTKKRRQIPFAQFEGGRWRKVVRRSAYARILDEDD